MLFALGSNGSGQLGIGHKEDMHKPTRCHLPQNFNSTTILSIAAGGNHTLLTSPGLLHAAGEAADSRYPLVRKYTEATETGRFRLAAMSVKLCSATWEASTWVDDMDRVFTCGSGNRGELGHGEGIISLPEPRFIKDFPPSELEEQIVDFSGSMSHTVAVLFNGDVYGWGAGRKGQLGHPAQDCWTPRKIEGITFEAYRAVCGRDFTYIVGAPGSGNHVILGSDKFNIIQNAPKTLPPWKEVGASWGSIFVLLQTGELLSWGRDDHGQLCPPNLPKIEQIAVGSEHVVALTEDGKVITWGWGEHGNCGQPTDDAGDVKGRWNELGIPGKVVTIGAGCATTFISTNESS
jgi:protein ATS1